MNTYGINLAATRLKSVDYPTPGVGSCHRVPGPLRKVPSADLPRGQTFGTAEAKKWGSGPARSSDRPVKVPAYGPVRGVIRSLLRVAPHVLARA